MTRARGRLIMREYGQLVLDPLQRIGGGLPLLGQHRGVVRERPDRRLDVRDLARERAELGTRCALLSPAAGCPLGVADDGGHLLRAEVLQPRRLLVALGHFQPQRAVERGDAALKIGARSLQFLLARLGRVMQRLGDAHERGSRRRCRASVAWSCRQVASRAWVARVSSARVFASSTASCCCFRSWAASRVRSALVAQRQATQIVVVGDDLLRPQVHGSAPSAWSIRRFNSLTRAGSK
jgi:hypothetical protein